MGDAVIGFPRSRPDLPFSGHGWLNDENRRTLASALTNDTTVVVEVGTWLGLSARYMCDLAPSATLYAVDHWLGSPEHIGVPEWECFLPTLWDQFVADCWDYRDRIVPVRGESLDGLQLLHGMGVEPDLIYLDGGHGYEQVRSDIEAITLLFPGVALIGDDWGWEGVRTAAVEHFGRDRIVVDGNCWCVNV
jgi:hypothetical protein